MAALLLKNLWKEILRVAIVSKDITWKALKKNSYKFITMSTQIKRTNDICSNCGASEGLHHYKTRQCPKNGIEETRWDEFNNKAYPQKWEETIFEDSGIKNFTDKAVNMHNDLIDALKSVIEYHDKDLLPVLKLSINKMIEQAERK